APRPFCGAAVISKVQSMECTDQKWNFHCVLTNHAWVFLSLAISIWTLSPRLVCCQDNNFCPENCRDVGFFRDLSLNLPCVASGCRRIESATKGIRRSQRLVGQSARIEFRSRSYRRRSGPQPSAKAGHYRPKPKPWPV